MDYEQMAARAAAECPGITDADTIHVTLSALSDHPGAAAVWAVFESGPAHTSLKAKMVRAGSFGYDRLEPLVTIERPGQPAVLYPNVDPQSAAQLVEEHIVGGAPIIDLALCSLGPDTIGCLPLAADLALFNLQQRIALANCGIIDPQEIAASIVLGQGYKGLFSALTMGPAKVIHQVAAAGLRGRGGAGYPVSKKWLAVQQAAGTEKVVVCNALDADPQARTARLLLESDPHRVLEGLLIAAYAVGAGRCIVCVDKAHPTALSRLERALTQMQAYGLIGAGILNARLTTEIQIQPMESALVTGEESALLRALAGRQAMPYLRPPFPAEKGLDGQPTLIQNIETLADVAVIFQESPHWFASIGTPGSTGSKIITVTGPAAHACTIEVPFGTSLRRIVAAAGAASNPQAVKAVQVGGPLGAYWSGDALDTALDYDSFAKSEAILGSGTVSLVDRAACMVSQTAQAMAYAQSQSCGQCVFCREGSLQMADILKSIQAGQGSPHDLALLAELGAQMRIGCICALGRNAANPVLSALALFRSDFDAHLHGQHCPAMVP